MGAAIDGAIRVFRERGYHAASVGDLCAATGLTAGSLYKAFRDKREIFLAAFDRYVSVRHGDLQRLLQTQPDGRGRIEALLRSYAELSHGGEGRRGCLVVSSAAELATLDPEMAERVEAAMQRTEALLRRLLEQGQDDGSIPRDIQAPAMARSLLALLQGYRIIGKSGRTREGMLAAVEQAMRMLA